MKKLIALLFGIIFSITTMSAKTQILPPDYFVGKWKILLEGTPGGDKTMIIHLERKDGKLVGAGIDPATGKEGVAFNKVEETEKSITIYFSAAGVDVYLNLEKKDDNHITGSMLDLFDANGERMK